MELQNKLKVEAEWETSTLYTNTVHKHVHKQFQHPEYRQISLWCKSKLHFTNTGAVLPVKSSHHVILMPGCSAVLMSLLPLNWSLLELLYRPWATMVSAHRSDEVMKLVPNLVLMQCRPVSTGGCTLISCAFSLPIITVIVCPYSFFPLPLLWLWFLWDFPLFLLSVLESSPRFSVLCT